MKRILFAIVIVLTPLVCGASGYALYEMNAAAAGMAQAYICRVEGPSAVWYNPAALSRIENTELSLSTTWIHTTSEFTPLVTPQTIDGISGNFFPTNLFVAHKFSEKMALGIGVYNPFGLQTEWPANSLASFVSQKAELRTFFITPSIGYKVNDHLSIGGGLDIAYADVSLRRNISLQPVSSIPIRNLVTADGTDVGFNVGVLIENYNDWAFAVTYKPTIDLDFSGDVTFSDVPPPITPLFPNGNANVKLPLPAQLMLGISKTYKPWSFEADFIWSKWDELDAIRLDFEQNTPLLTDQTLRREYENSWSARFGAEYQWNDMLAIRGGYYFDQTGAPDQAIDPILPDGSRNSISVGVGLDFGSYNIDVAYIALLFDERTSPLNNFTPPPGNLAAAGDYSLGANLLSLGFRYRF